MGRTLDEKEKALIKKVSKNRTEGTRISCRLEVLDKPCYSYSKMQEMARTPLSVTNKSPKQLEKQIKKLESLKKKIKDGAEKRRKI